MNRLTKIICTLGPATNSFEMINKLAELDVNVIRFNFSHSDIESHEKYMNRVRQVSEETGKPLAILLDTKGPEIRCGLFENDMAMFNKGDIVKVSKAEVLGTHDMFHIKCPELFDDIEVNDYILIDDGKQKITVLENDGSMLTCRVEVSAPIKSNKGCNVPGVKLTMPFINEKDYNDILFACRYGVDFIAASFVRSKKDLLQLKQILNENGGENIQVIAKIENREGYDNIQEILEIADGVMVARGDLGVEVETQYIPIFQKQMIKIANSLGKPVITATHMMESMMASPRPTRAEASDVANAVLDGSDAVMLSGESATGIYPIETVTIMSNICKASENIIDYSDKLHNSKKSNQKTIQDAIGISISDTTIALDIAAIVVFTQSGSTARRISKFRPNAPILAVTFDKKIQRSLACQWGVKALYSDITNEMINDDELASKIAKENGYKPGQLIIIAAGYPTGEGNTNMMKIVTIK